MTSELYTHQLRSATSRTSVVRRTYCNYMETGVCVSQLQVRSCGTAFQLNCDKLILAFNNSNGYSRHFCLGAEIAAHCD